MKRKNDRTGKPTRTASGEQPAPPAPARLSEAAEAEIAALEATLPRDEATQPPDEATLPPEEATQPPDEATGEPESPGPPRPRRRR